VSSVLRRGVDAGERVGVGAVNGTRVIDKSYRWLFTFR
jgi:hypothetical protein